MIQSLRKLLLNMKLRPKLMFFFVCSAVLPILIASVFSITYFSSITLENARTNLKDKLHTSELLYEKKKNEVDNLAKTIATDNLVILNLELLLYPPLSDYLNKNIIAKRISFLAIVDLSGKLIVSDKRIYFNSPLKPLLSPHLLERVNNRGPVSFTTSLHKDEYRDFTFTISNSPLVEDCISLVSICPIFSYTKQKLGYVVAGFILGDTQTGVGLIKEICHSVGTDMLIIGEHKPLIYSEGLLDSHKISFSDNILKKIMEQKKSLFHTIYIDGKTYLFCFSPHIYRDNLLPVSMGVGFPRGDYVKARNRVALWLGVITFLSILISMVIAYILSKDIARPIFSMVEAARLIAAGDFKKKVHVKSDDEIGVLASAFNSMTAQLSRRIEMDRMISDISRKFINIPLKQVDKAIHESLNEISRYVNVDRSYIFMLKPDLQEISYTYCWSPKKAHVKNFKKIDAITFTDQIPWIMKKMRKFEALCISQLEQLPDEAIREKELFLSLQLKSFMTIPLVYGKRLRGFIHFFFYRKENPCSIDDIVLIRMFGEIICNALERKKSEEEITKTKDYLKNVFNAQSSLLISVNHQAAITELNKMAEQYIGIRKKKALGKEVWNIVPFLGDYKHIIFTSIRKAHSRHTQLKINLPNDKKYFNLSIVPLRSNDGNGALLRLDDITELERKNEQLIQAQKMETVGTLAGGIAHDFNNILSGVTGTVTFMKYMLGKNELDIEKIKEQIDLIYRSSNRASDMVKQLLALSRKHEVTLQPVDLNEVIRDIEKMGKNVFDKCILLETYYAEQPAIVEADFNQILQVILNLCINSVHAMTIMRDEANKGGMLVVSIEKIKVTKHFYAIHPEAKSKQYQVIRICDTGVGINQDVLPKIFDPFFSTKEKGQGTGLGLTMVYNIIKQHHGFINVSSVEGIGSTFNIFLPVLRSNQLPTIQTTNNEEIPRGEGTVLVVDDEEIMLLTASNILTECGYKVITASNGDEAVRLYQKQHEKIDVVVMDMSMPVKSGEEAYHEMKSITQDLEIIFTSGFKQDKRVQAVLDQGIKSFIQKPYSMNELAWAVYDCLKK